MANKKPFTMTRAAIEKLKKECANEAIRTLVTCYVQAMIDEGYTMDEAEKVYVRFDRYVGYLQEGQMKLTEAEQILKRHGAEVVYAKD